LHGSRAVRAGVADAAISSLSRSEAVRSSAFAEIAPVSGAIVGSGARRALATGVIGPCCDLPLRSMSSGPWARRPTTATPEILLGVGQLGLTVVRAAYWPAPATGNC
jgi:hypothetical protein